MKALDVISVVEAAYRVDATEHAWLERLAVALEGFVDAKRGAIAFLYDASEADRLRVVDAAVHGLPDRFGAEFLQRPTAPADLADLVAAFNPLPFGTLRTATLPPRTAALYAGLLDRLGIDDVICLNGRDPPTGGCLLAVADSFTGAHRREGVWRRLAAHIAAGARLRRRLRELEASPTSAVDRADAVLTANGRVEHATGRARAASARESLREGLAAMHRARARRVQPEQGLELWEALVGGRWSIVEHFEKNGKLYYLAHRNDPGLEPDRALSARERQVLASVERGESNKHIAHTLGVSTSAVSTTLTRAYRKLGV